MATSFSILAPLQSYLNQQGAILAGGRIDFFLAGTSTATDVFGDEALTVNNGSSVALDAAGYPSVQIWGDATKEYKARLYDADGVLQDEADYLRVEGDTFPSGTDGQFLGLSGGVPTFQTIIQVPSPSGHADKYLTNDGTTVLWVEPGDGCRRVWSRTRPSPLRPPPTSTCRPGFR